MIIGILLALALIWIFHFATHIYVCKHDFIEDVAFELIKRSSLKPFLQSKQAFKTGDTFFDNQVYISSDLAVLHKLLEDKDIRDSILAIIQNENVHGIYVSDGQIKVRTVGVSHKHPEGIKSLDARLNFQVLGLKNKLVNGLNGLIQNKEELSFAHKIQGSIKRINIFYWFFFPISYALVTEYSTSFGNHFYLETASFFEMLLVFVLALILSVGIIGLKLRNSVRCHTLFYKTLFMLIPACLFFSAIVVDMTNVVLADEKELVTTQENIKLKYEGNGKGGRYYVSVEDSENEVLSKHSPMLINRDTYWELEREDVATFKVEKGYWGKHYFSVKK